MSAASDEAMSSGSQPPCPILPRFAPTKASSRPPTTAAAVATCHTGQCQASRARVSSSPVVMTRVQVTATP
ncbi:MAG TPA: hypothetical protein VH573_07450 [Mycobacteriales bacterium]